MMSMYAKYLTERTNDKIFEDDYGWASYRYLDDGKTVYIIEIYVEEKVRKDGHASKMADRICKEAKEKGCVKLIGSVVPTTKNSTISMKVLLGYGMELEIASNNFILFKKEL